MTYKKDWTKIPAQYQDFRPFFYEGFKNAESLFFIHHYVIMYYLQIQQIVLELIRRSEQKKEYAK